MSKSILRPPFSVRDLVLGAALAGGIAATTAIGIKSLFMGAHDSRRAQ